jgi:N-acetylglucosamine-6-sulfatase
MRMSRQALPTGKHTSLAVVAGLALALASVAMTSSGLAAFSPTANDLQGNSVQTMADTRPNIVLILADDLDKKSVSRLPTLKSLLVDRGTTFSNAFVTNSLCCPSRATILRGQYSHNHQIFTNVRDTGGLDQFIALGHENSTIATWLRSGGYRTVLIGKYFNNYDATDGVRPGWSEWYGSTGAEYYQYKINENGTVVSYPDTDPQSYQPDVHTRQAVDFVERAAAGSQPFFLYLAPRTPHQPATPAVRHENLFPGVTAPKPPSFNEQGVADKPSWVRSLSLLDSQEIASIDEHYRNRLQSMAAVEDMVESVINALQNSGKLDNTYIFFTSDNGFHMGHHRLKAGKRTAYEEDIRVPLIVRGPGVPAGGTLRHMVINNDLAPTFAKLAGVSAPTFVDGRSLTPLLTSSPPTTANWRSAFETEAAGIGNRPAYQAVRTHQYLYVEYASGARELYNLYTDPYQLSNVYAASDPALVTRLKARLDALRNCAGGGCRSAEGGA